MNSFEKYQNLRRLLDICRRDQLRAKERMMRDNFEEQAMKRRLFYRVKWPPLNQNMSWRSTRRALIRQPAFKTVYFSENRTRLYELLEIRTPEDLLRREKSIREKIDQLPPVEIARTGLRAGAEHVLNSKFFVRIYIPLSERGDFNGSEELGHSWDAHIAGSLDEYAALTSIHDPKELFVSTISKSGHFAENSHISTEERAVCGYRDEVYDFTRLSLNLLLSQTSFQTIDGLSGDWIASEPKKGQRRALLAIDVPSDTHLIRRKLGKGEGGTFGSISCPERIVDGFHLHLCNASNEPVHSFALRETDGRS